MKNLRALNAAPTPIRRLLGLRIGKNPRVVATTTPRPIKLIRDLLAREGKDAAVTRGRTIENVANLAPAFLSEIMRRYEGTRLGGQELDAEVFEDVPGALWQREWFDRDRVTVTPDNLQRVIVAIDSAMSSTEGSDETAIVVAAIADDHGNILDDMSGRMAPHEWATRAVEAYRRYITSAASLRSKISAPASPPPSIDRVPVILRIVSTRWCGL